MTLDIQKVEIVVLAGVGSGVVNFGTAGLELKVFSIRTGSPTNKTVSLFGYDAELDPAFGVESATVKAGLPYYSGLVNTPCKGPHTISLAGDDGTYYICTRGMAS